MVNTTVISPQAPPAVVRPDAAVLHVEDGGLVSKIGRFITNKGWRVYVGVILFVVVGGLSCCYIRGGRGGSGGSARRLEPAAGKEAQKKRRKRKSVASGNDEKRPPDAENTEILPASSNESEGTGAAANNEAAWKASVADEEDADDQYVNEELTEEQIAAMGPEERSHRSLEIKELGNDFYVRGKYKTAIKIYSLAIALHPDPVYYSNRAACYASLDQHDKVIEDCNAALKRQPGYIKALNRRALAHELLGNNEEALQDYTASCILDSFRNAEAATSMEKVLRKVADGKAGELMKSKKPRLPSAAFMKAYMDSFHKLPEDEAELMAQPSVEETADATQEYLRAHALLKARKYGDAMAAAERAVDLGDSEYRAKAIALRGTFSFLKHQTEEALRDFEAALELNPKDTRSRIKKAGIYMEQGNGDEAFKEFDLAVEARPEDAEVYYHRGQIRFVIGDFDGAIADYMRSIELDSSFVFSYIQLGVAQYKKDLSEQAGIDRAMKTFAEAVAKFPRSSELQHYYGEVLLDQGLVDEAAAAFEKAISLDPINPLPHVNAALVNFQFRRDFTTAEKFLRKAMKVDSECDVAYMTLGQIYIQLGKINEAIEMFDHAIEIAHTDGEAAEAIGLRESAKSRIRFAKEHPDYAGHLAAMHGNW